MRRLFLFHAVILAILFCLSNCGEEQDEPQLTNPFDPKNPETQGDPFHLSVELKERKSVLIWKEPSGCEFDNYIIYRRIGNDTEVKVATVPRGTTRYTDTTIVAGHQYTYRISVARSTKQSPLSRITDKSSVYLNILPTVTINPLEIDGNDVTISWSATDDDGEVVGYSYRFNNGDWSQYLPDTKHTFKDLKAGKYTVEVKAKDDAQDEGPITQHVFTLTIDFAAQLTINNNNPYTNSTAVKLNLSAKYAVEMRVSNQADFSNSQWQPYQQTLNWTLPGGDAIKNVYAQFKDEVGNESSVISTQITLDTLPPTGSVAINDGASVTNNPNVQLTLQAADAGSGVSHMRISNTPELGDVTWEMYSSRKSWQLQPSMGKHTVFVQFRDKAGCVSDMISTSIRFVAGWYVSTTGDDDTTLKTIQEGIDAASDGDIVWVADGIYRGIGNKDLDFKGKAIIVQSENGPESTIIDCENSGRGFYFHSSEKASSKVDGFTIKNGRADIGGGIFCDFSSPQITNNIITQNSASYSGGGVYCGNSPSYAPPQITNNIITENSAGKGGGISIMYSSPVITNNIITENSTTGYGGGISIMYSSPVITNNIITGNSANNYDNGGIYCYASSPVISNSIIAKNSPGGISCPGYFNDSSPTIINCTISDNSEFGIYYYAEDNSRNSKSSLKILNTILWNKNHFTNPSFGSAIKRTSITYSDILGGYPGKGNINADPLFVDPAKGDYHLQPGSPCLDSATGKEAPTTDIDGHPRPLGGGYDMGAYEQ